MWKRAGNKGEDRLSFPELWDFLASNATKKPHERRGVRAPIPYKYAAGRFKLEQRAKRIFAGADRSGGDKLSYLEIKKALETAPWDWGALALDAAEGMARLDALIASSPDVTVDHLAFLDAITREPRCHAHDPSLASLAYMDRHRLQELFEFLTSSLIYQKPSDPVAFVVEQLVALKSFAKKSEDYLTDEDLEVVFSLFDVAGRGWITPEHCNEAMASIGCAGANCRSVDLLGPRVTQVSQADFVKACRGALEEFAAIL
eukprot:jgi/Mesvir1/12431/Mv00596-RA.1